MWLYLNQEFDAIKIKRAVITIKVKLKRLKTYVALKN